MKTRHHPKRNLYETRVTVNGERKSFYGKSISEAEEKAVEHLESLASPSLKELTLAEFYARAYLPTVKGHSLKWRQQIDWAWGKVPDRFKHRPIKDITRQELQVFFNGLKLGRTSVGHVRRVLHAVFGLAEADDLVSRNPIRAIKLAPNRTAKIQPYTDEELRRLIDAADGMACRNAVVLAGLLGLRRGECLGLMWSDIRGGKVYVERQLTGPLKTACSRRAIPLPAGLVLTPNDTPYVVEVRNERNLSGYASDERGTGRGYARAVEKAGLEHKPFHSLRKTCATELERAGCPQGLISAILGHSGGGVTRLYIHNDQALMRHYLEAVCLAVTGVHRGVQGRGELPANEGESA